VKLIRRNEQPHLSARSGQPREMYFFYEKNTGVAHFNVEAGPDGQFPVEQAAGLLAMHCMVRGQSPNDYIVMVPAENDFLDGLKEKADKLLQAGRSAGSSVKLTRREDEVLGGIMRSLAPQKLQPAEMLKQMNQIVGERKIEGRFMTACFATWQKGKQKLRVANAGQSQPLLYKDGRCERIELSGFPLGIFEDVEYDEWGVTLDTGDVLVFHSDGLAETSNREGQFFGTTRMVKLIEQHHQLNAADLADLLLREVDWFSQDAPLYDDRTLVIAKVR